MECLSKNVLQRQLQASPPCGNQEQSNQRLAFRVCILLLSLLTFESFHYNPKRHCLVPHELLEECYLIEVLHPSQNSSMEYDIHVQSPVKN